MAYLKNWTDNFFQMFFMGTSWVAVSINNIKTRASRETLPSTEIWRGEVFAISDCLDNICMNIGMIYSSIGTCAYA